MRGLVFFGLMLTAGWLLPVAGLMGQAAGGFGATVHYGSIFAHSEAVQNTRGAQPLGIELQYWRQRRDSAVYNTCRCYPRSGPLLFYTHFDSRILGSATGAGWLLEPNYRLAPNLHLQMRAAAGLLVANRPYDALTNATNQSYSTRLNAWLMYGLGVNWELTERLTLQVSGNFQHLSNGGVRQPNKGVNWPTASVGMLVQRESAAYFRGLRQPWQRGAQRPLTWEVGAFGVAKRVVSPSGIGTRYPVVGVWGLASRQVAHTNALAAGLELSYDASLAERLKQDSVSGHGYKLGLMAGHEFLLGRFVFSQRLGLYLHQRNPYYDGWYHRWGLQYRVGSNWWAGVGLRAHRHVADFFDVRVVRRW